MRNCKRETDKPQRAAASIASRRPLYLPCSAAVEREQAVTAETHSFLDRVYQGSVGLMMSAMARRQELSREEIDQLYEALRKLEEKGHD